jgi:hypothetical protein
MPGLAHVAISLLLVAFLWKVSRGELNYRHGIIFTINSMVGPDLFSWMPYDFGFWGSIYWFIHGIGWPIMAFLVALPWFYINNSRFEGEGKARKIVPRPKDDRFYLPYLQVFMLVAGGGLFHQFVDVIGHPPFIVHPDSGQTVPWGIVWMLYPGALFSMDWILSTGTFPCGNYWGYPEYVPTLIIAVLILLFLAFKVVPKEEGKSFMVVALGFFIGYLVLLGSAYLIPDFGPWHFSGGEADFGVMVFFALFFFLPMLFLFWGYRGLPGKRTAQQNQ